MRIIPDAPVLYMGENKTLSVVVAREHASDHLDVELDPEGVVELLDGVPVALEDHPVANVLSAGSACDRLTRMKKHTHRALRDLATRLR